MRIEPPKIVKVREYKKKLSTDTRIKIVNCQYCRAKNKPERRGGNCFVCGRPIPETQRLRILKVYNDD
jgi:hypothetical protein